MLLLRNTSGQKITVFAFDLATQEPFTGDASSITCKISIDGGTFTALTDTNPTENEAGRYTFDLSQAETNGYSLRFIPVSATGGVMVIAIPESISTLPAAFIGIATERFLRAVNAITIGTVGSSASTTSVPTSALNPAATKIDQFKGQILCFDKDTTTTNLRGQKTVITGNDGSGVLTVTALTDAPQSGDTFTIQ